MPRLRSVALKPGVEGWPLTCSGSAGTRPDVDAIDTAIAVAGEGMKPVVVGSADGTEAR